MSLSADDFAGFFQEVHGFTPFPWQDRLARRLAHGDVWPDLLDLPTGSGKTAAIDIAVFHLALEAAREAPRHAPVRIAFIVDRRLVVDDAFASASKLVHALREPAGPVSSRVAEQLKRLSGEGPPLVARRLRGGIPREDDWARTPAQPTVLCSTVDQVGSRLLFRGYGVSDSMKPVHAGLIGSDCLLLLDEVHLAEPFRQTLRWIQTYNGERWRETEIMTPWRVALLSATPAEGRRDMFDGTEPVPFGLDDDDWTHPVLARRLNASKPARLVAPATPKGKRPDEAGTGDEIEAEDEDIARRAAIVVKEARAAFDHFQRADSGVPPAICVVLNRVARARAVFEHVRKEFGREIESGVAAEPILMIGPARPLDRDDLVERIEPIRTVAWKDDDVRVLHQAVLVIATQCIEAGVDLDFDALVTEAAPIDALRQRFGRLNRAGRTITPYAAVVGMKSDFSARYDDPVYGIAIKPAWDYLTGQPDGTVDGVATADFGISAFMRRMTRTPIPSQAVSEKDDAPVLLPAHLDLLSQTSPIPTADPDIALYLHGTTRQPDSITVVWRADLNPLEAQDEDTRKLLMLVPPRQREAIQLPIWAVRRWLVAGTKPMGALADVAVSEPVDDDRVELDGGGRRVFRWKGDDERSTWVDPSDIRPGDTIIVPSRYGGSDKFGWDPQSKEPVTDRARSASQPFVGRRFAVRVAPGLLGSSVSNDTLADALARAVSPNWKDVRAVLFELDLPDDVRADLDALQNAGKGGRAIVAYRDLYGRDDQGRPRGVVFHAPFGIRAAPQGDEDGQTNSSEDDTAGSLAGFSLPLREHNGDVAEKAALFGTAMGLPASRVNDLMAAGRFHDCGKADPRFQAWLHFGDPLGPAPDHLLAKSGRRLPRQARAMSGLPDRWRHEALSVRRARAEHALADADDPELILWLIGTHHGYGRPLFPHGDPTETAPDVGPQSLAFDWQGLDWPMLFERLKSRYGVWELARMEAVLRLADHRASEDRAVEESK
ncbi:MAG: type I-U CRISPR-associated helicase/endonuclease Cas3 [Acidobacteria bacterium]|nr:type I-U CRISPR-associated helicase/endonuclease Cas3 [Acidobacteriota bacterium]